MRAKAVYYSLFENGKKVNLVMFGGRVEIVWAWNTAVIHVTNLFHPSITTTIQGAFDITIKG